MILFQNDFYKTPYYLQNTTNKTFIRMHYLLKKMGIKNNSFFLALYQKELEGIDPTNISQITPELAGKISVECKINPWYYFREVLRIPSQGGEAVPFMLNRANLALIWSFFNGIDFYLVQPRQTGKTISTQGIASWLTHIGGKGLTMAMYTKDNTLREENVNRLRRIRDILPPYLTHFNKLEDTTNKQRLAYKSLETRYDTFVAQSDVMGADKIGRGGTVPIVHIDESEFFDNIRITYPVLAGTMTAAIKQAKANGLPHGVIITSTAGRLENDSCQYCIEMISKAMPFSESLYDCENKEKLEELISLNSTNKLLYGQFSYLQLGLTDEWLKDAIARSNASRDVILREYLCIRTSGVDNSVIPIHLLEKIKSSSKDPVKVETVKNRYIFRWYIDPDIILNDKNRPVIIGLDTSECIGKDFTSLVMLDATDMNVVCTARCNESDLIKLALYIAEFMTKNKNTILVPERKSTASMMIAIICSELRKSGINPWTRIFNMVIQNKYEDNFKDIDITEPGIEEGALKKYLGFSTTGSGETSRSALYTNTLMKAVEMNHSRINDQTLITELASLAQKNGRIDHTASGHDDTVIAFLLASFFIFFGKNLHLYNINSKTFLDEVTAKGTKIDKLEKQRQKEILEEIINLKKEIKRLKLSSYVTPLERQLKHLESLLDQETLESIPVTAEQVTIKNKPKNIDYVKLAHMYYQ